VKLGVEVVVNKAQADDPRVCGISQVSQFRRTSLLFIAVIRSAAHMDVQRAELRTRRLCVCR